MLTPLTLRSQVDALRNKFWSGGVNKPLDSIEQMSFLFFLKRLEDIENQRMASVERKAFFLSKYVIVSSKYNLGNRRYKENEYMVLECKRPAVILERSNGLDKEIHELLNGLE